MEYVAIKKNDDDELMHYGVLGMKWGVRRNVNVLANHRRNQSVKRIKNSYEIGKISKDEKRSQIKNENAKKKDYINKSKTKLKNMKTKQEVQQYKNNIAKQTISEVPNSRIKKGATTVNKIFAGMHVGSNVAGGIATAAMIPAAAPLALGTYATAALAEIGAHALVQMGINKLS